MGLRKKKLEKNQEHDENMENDDPTWLVIKTSHGGGFKFVNVVGASSGLNLEDAKFEAMYDEEVHFFRNKLGGFSTELSKFG